MHLFNSFTLSKQLYVTNLGTLFTNTESFKNEDREAYLMPPLPPLDRV